LKIYYWYIKHLCQHFNINSYFLACQPNQTVIDAQLLIEVIKLLGTVSKDENCGELLYEHGTIQQVINLLKSKI